MSSIELVDEVRCPLLGFLLQRSTIRTHGGVQHPYGYSQHREASCVTLNVIQLTFEVSERVDFSMPGLSGLDVVSKLRADRIEIPAIIITGTDDAELEAKSIDAGARALLRKPISEHRLFAAIESVLAGELITQNG